MARWARVDHARNWHLTEATATQDLRRSACGFVLRPVELLAPNVLPERGQPCCSHCLQAYVAEGQQSWLDQAMGGKAP